MGQRRVANDRVECDHGGGTFESAQDHASKVGFPEGVLVPMYVCAVARTKINGVWSENVRTEAQPKTKMDEMRNNPRELVQRTKKLESTCLLLEEGKPAEVPQQKLKEL